MLAPQATLPQDQLGFGFLQWYAQDVAEMHIFSSAQNPETEQLTSGHLPNRSLSIQRSVNDHHGLPSAAHFFFYHILGDIGFIGYSGAHTWESQEHLFREACAHLAHEQPNQVYVLGHWSKQDLGCQAGMDVPSLTSRLRAGPCREIASRMFYFMGHDHCNRIAPDGRGFLVGGGGAKQGSGVCSKRGAQSMVGWGFAYIDTRDESGEVACNAKNASGHLIAKFTVATDEADYSNDLTSCILRRGSLRRCVGAPYSAVWVNGTAASTN